MSTVGADESGPWRVDHVALRMELTLDRIEVTSTLSVTETGSGTGPLVLDGQGLETLEVLVDGVTRNADEYGLTETSLTIPLDGGPHQVTTRVVVRPAPLHSKGVVRGASLLFTDCEPQGFRRISWSLDRPSNRATFSVTLVGEARQFPVMLSNGQRVDGGEGDDGRRWVTFDDPVTKPTYLFSMVAGDLATRSQSRRTRSGRNVLLTVAAPPDLIDGADFALALLDEVMTFDEQNGAIEYDLDELTFVAVPGYSDATEYHGLMFFEPSLLVSDPRGGVDDDLLLIAANVAHEYGHHVRGNRVTVSSWGQLALKEGLTVLEGQNDFRRHWLGDAARVLDVLDLRRLQFPEEVTIGAPVLRGEVPDPRALYNRTTYLKGAEIFGMIRTLVGDAAWRDATGRFVARHDLGAASVADFLGVVRECAVDHVSHIDGVSRWFTSVGRPSIDIVPSASDIVIRRTDALSDDPPLAMPVVLGFLDTAGRPLAVTLDGGATAEEHTVVLTGREHHATVSSPRPFVLSPLRRYSSPVDVTVDVSAEVLATLVEHDDDPFARWWACQELMIRVVDAVRAGRSADAEVLLDVAAAALRAAVSGVEDPILVANLLAVPDEFMLGDRDAQIDVDGVSTGLDALRHGLGVRLHDDVVRVMERFGDDSPGGATRHDIATRWVVEPALALLLASGSDDAVRLARVQIDGADQTRAVRALSQLVHRDDIDLDTVLAATYARWQHAPKLVDRWLRAQSGSRRRDTVARVRELAAGPLYDRDDRARVMAVWFPFATRNRSVFHTNTGEGYRIFVDELGELMPVNAGLAVRLVGDLLQFKRFDPVRRDLLRNELTRMADMDGMPEFAVGILRSLLA